MPPLDHEEREEAASNLLRAKIDKSVKSTPPFRPSDLKLIDKTTPFILQTVYVTLFVTHVFLSCVPSVTLS